MLVWRHVVKATQGNSNKLFDLVVEIHKQNPWPHTVRVYKSHTGLQDQVIVEAECESLAEFEEAQKHWLSRGSEEGPNLLDLMDTGGHIEFLTVTPIPAEE